MNKNAQRLAEALMACGIHATVSTRAALGIDDKRHWCTFIETDYWTGEENLEILLHPDTGKYIGGSISECPLVNI